jgi:epsilon-lactone hydrolase
MLDFNDFFYFVQVVDPQAAKLCGSTRRSAQLSLETHLIAIETAKGSVAFMWPSTDISWQAKVLRVALRFINKRRDSRIPPLAAVRKRFERIEPFVPEPPKGTQTTVIEASGVPGVRVDVPQARKDRCILFFHGGGYSLGSATLYRDFMWRIGMAARALVFYFDYRLAPEHPFPAALEDALQVNNWVMTQFDAQKIAFLGDSAGGGLALATLHKLRDRGRVLPRAVVALSPWTDLALTGGSLRSNVELDPVMIAARFPMIAKRYLGDADPRNPYASPLYGDAEGFPPTLIHVGSDEVLLDDAVRMADRMRMAGCEVEIEVWPKMPHVWHLYARVLPEGRQAIDRIGRFLEHWL